MPNLLQCFITVLQIKCFQLAGDFELTTVGIYVFEVNNRNTRCKICSNLTIKIPNELISHLVLVFLLLSLNM